MPRRKLSAADYAAYLLTRRLQSRHELEEKLARKKYESEDIQDVIKRFTELNLINDERFARSYVSDKVDFARRGRWRIALELKKKGIAKELIDMSINEIDPTDELEAARAVLTGRERLWANLEPQKKYQRSVGLLSRRGFSVKIIQTVLRTDSEE